MRCKSAAGNDILTDKYSGRVIVIAWLRDALLEKDNKWLFRKLFKRHGLFGDAEYLFATKPEDFYWNAKNVISYIFAPNEVVLDMIDPRSKEKFSGWLCMAKFDSKIDLSRVSEKWQKSIAQLMAVCNHQRYKLIYPNLTFLQYLRKHIEVAHENFRCLLQNHFHIRLAIELKRSITGEIPKLIGVEESTRKRFSSEFDRHNQGLVVDGKEKINSVRQLMVFWHKHSLKQLSHSKASITKVGSGLGQEG